MIADWPELSPFQVHCHQGDLQPGGETQSGFPGRTLKTGFSDECLANSPTGMCGPRQKAEAGSGGYVQHAIANRNTQLRFAIGMAENSERKVLKSKSATVAICRLNPAFAITDVRFVERVQKSPMCKIQL